ncbi:hypothetical protein [Microbacterium sp. 13-71-7]|jgi:hypothetical protein|uniref:hypothetical protein n=1 Tax=Microbacterium sp. 13-71-7 TaxID=1970399 RepID=UPI000BCFFE95|nr:hypothetical protein [Microbacterium sp. 13-71-7]OZB85063.1 MAG: hypothetical protein B7X32_04915 [Microbacterium sp. 13-71-7]
MNASLARLAHTLVMSVFFVANVMLLGFGFGDPLVLLAVLSATVSLSVFMPFIARETATIEFTAGRLGETFDTRGREGSGLTLDRYASVRGILVRRRVRKAFPATGTPSYRRFDVVLPLLFAAAQLLLIFCLMQLRG